MIFRRVVYVAMFPAAVVAPLAALVARTIVAGAQPAVFLASLLLGGLGFLVLALVTVLVAVRKQVRATRSVSWLDAALLTVLAVAVVASGIVDAPWVPAIAVVLAIGTFWVAVWELVTETRTRVRTFMSDLEQVAQRPTPTSNARGTGDVYIVQPSVIQPSVVQPTVIRPPEQ
jgi:hypothetical protein